MLTHDLPTSGLSQSIGRLIGVLVEKERNRKIEYRLEIGRLRDCIMRYKLFLIMVGRR